MKKLILSIAIAAASVAVASAQGTIKFYNITAAYDVSTNGTGTGPGLNGTTTGLVGTSTTYPNGYYFTVLIDATTPTSANPLTGGWSDASSGGAPVIGKNYSLAGGINGTGGTAGVAIDGWAGGVSDYVEVVGWSASLGTTWSAIAAELNSGWTAAGYYGVSSIADVASGGIGTPVSGPAAIFSPTAIPTGFDLNGVSPVPEPTTMALAAVGSLSLLALRRKKS